MYCRWFKTVLRTDAASWNYASRGLRQTCSPSRDHHIIDGNRSTVAAARVSPTWTIGQSIKWRHTHYSVKYIRCNAKIRSASSTERRLYVPAFILASRCPPTTSANIQRYQQTLNPSKRTVEAVWRELNNAQVTSVSCRVSVLVYVSRNSTAVSQIYDAETRIFRGLIKKNWTQHGWKTNMLTSRCIAITHKHQVILLPYERQLQDKVHQADDKLAREHWTTTAVLFSMRINPPFRFQSEIQSDFAHKHYSRYRSSYEDETDCYPTWSRQLFDASITGANCRVLHVGYHHLTDVYSNDNWK